MINDDDNLTTLRDLVRRGASMFNEAELFFGHGTDNALDEALQLVLHALHLDHTLPQSYLDAHLTGDEKARVLELLQQRIRERVPAAYLTGKAWFTGLEFDVSRDVLVPRSPIAELIEEQFSPWLDASGVNAILDLCSGSGCIAIACAYAFPQAQVDAVDISEAALKIARVNVDRHHLHERVAVIASDLFDQLPPRQYDLIVSNPPYVSSDEYRELPPEYQHEPEIGLEAGSDGMDVVARILQDAAPYLAPGGIIIVEVGASADLLMARFPDIPFLWLDFEKGGDGVFLLTAEQLRDCRVGGASSQ
ncbi:MAG: 50S ribosomal protein L3 N(5)-glutamine methyltransferase [Gammaproteobacteria bacterium]|nr:50S ribosomal protein L3 N(5)-glutamine methyltransferase [Gammaproteobacteria bacterium]